MKPIQVRQCVDEAILNGVECVGLVAEQPIGHSIGDAAIAAEQFIEGRTIPRGELCQKHIVRESGGQSHR